VFIVLVTRAILSFDLNFYIPISKVTENMETAHRRDAVLNEKFWFRRKVLPERIPRPERANGGIASGTATPAISRPPTPTGPVEDEYRLMTVDEIINGTAHHHKHMAENGDVLEGDIGEEDNFPGLIPLVEAYLDSVNIDVATRCELSRYLDLIKKRADGTLWTAAKWMREFVRTHEDYKFDSVVGDKINHDLIGAVIAIERDGGEGVKNVDKLLGKVRKEKPCY
jgi:glutamate--cysteine ligase catalytic subunit